MSTRRLQNLILHAILLFIQQGLALPRDSIYKHSTTLHKRHATNPHIRPDFKIDPYLTVGRSSRDATVNFPRAPLPITNQVVSAKRHHRQAKRSSQPYKQIHRQAKRSSQSVTEIPPAKSSRQVKRSEEDESLLRNFVMEAGSMVFLSPNNSVVVAHVGSSITLSCVVQKDAQFGMITWARHIASDKTLQVLTIGDSTYINDQRFLVVKKPTDNDWQLKIQQVSLLDGGRYECQATTHPPQYIIVTLNVVEAYAEIQVEDSRGKENINKGDQDGANRQKEKFIKSGSQLKLNCALRKATQKPLYIFWYHNNSMINYNQENGRFVNFTKDGWSSTLKIPSVSRGDGGNYTCAPHNIAPDSVVVHIVDRDTGPQAVHKDETSAAHSPAADLAIAALIVMFQRCRRLQSSQLPH